MNKEKKSSGIYRAYKVLGWIFAAIAFAASWVYCIYENGYLLGVGLGWLPSIIVAILARWIWPLPVALAAGYLATQIPEAFWTNTFTAVLIVALFVVLPVLVLLLWSKTAKGIASGLERSGYPSHDAGGLLFALVGLLAFVPLSFLNPKFIWFSAFLAVWLVVVSYLILRGKKGSPRPEREASSEDA